MHPKVPEVHPWWKTGGRNFFLQPEVNCPSDLHQQRAWLEKKVARWLGSEWTIRPVKTEVHIITQRQHRGAILHCVDHMTLQCLHAPQARVQFLSHWDLVEPVWRRTGTGWPSTGLPASQNSPEARGNKQTCNPSKELTPRQLAGSENQSN